jgi:hypothetical protein
MFDSHRLWNGAAARQRKHNKMKGTHHGPQGGSTIFFLLDSFLFLFGFDVAKLSDGDLQ